MTASTLHLPLSIRDARVRRTAPSSAAARTDNSPPGIPAQETGGALDSAPAVDATMQRLQQMLQRLESQLAMCQSQREQSLRELQMLAVELAVAAAEQIVMRAVHAGDYDVERTVQSAVERLGMHQPLTIFLPPDDLQLLRERLLTQPDSAFLTSCELRTDPTLGPGDCRVEAADGVGVMREAAVVLSQLRELWLQELSDAQIERRNSPAAQAGLKRFPDRRETA